METFEGLIVKQIAFKESSKILHVYTAEGMKSVLVHGAKKFKSPYLSASENLNLVRIVAVGKDIKTLTDADLLEAYPAIKGDLVKLTYAQHLAELLHFFAEAEYDHAKFFAFTKKILAKLETETDYAVFAYMFELKFLFLLGVAPAFAACASCGKKEDLVFFARAGGASCPDHAEGPAASADAFLWMRMLYGFDLKDALAARPVPATSEEIRRVIDDYYAFHLNFRSKSRAMLSGLLGY